MAVTHDAGHQASANWRGRSGRIYAAAPEALDQFALKGHDLFLIAKGSRVLWIGTETDLIGDYRSRARFRKAMATADRVLRLVPPSGDEGDKLSMVWDLEGGGPASSQSAA